ncbi:MAG: hypothetical protein V4664_02610 [Patescibacteria group bacterium]
MKNHKRGFAALLLVVSLSLSIILALVEAGNSTWLLKQDVIMLGDRTQRQLAAEVCHQLALLYMSENPDYSDPIYFEFGRGIHCSIVSITPNNPSPFADRVIETIGTYAGVSSSMVSIVGVTNRGLIQKQRYFK